MLHRLTRLFSALCLVGIVGCALPSSATASPAAFRVQFGETTVTHRIMAVLALPETPVRVAVPGPSDGPYRLETSGHTVRRLADDRWELTPPQRPGLYPVTISDSARGASVRLQVFVLRPWDHDGRSLNGYRIGAYEQEPRAGRARYEPPAGFVRVTAANRRARVSPHFRLDQFLCKQTDALPQYALVRPRLLRTLEALVDTVRARGHSVETLHVMSGYRTPYYNRAIGNTTEYSRHLYGDAADVFVDANGDGRMDDLTGDGRVSTADAAALARWIRTIPTEGSSSFVGGLSAYGPAPHRGPFVHLDLRGVRARW